MADSLSPVPESGLEKIAPRGWRALVERLLGPHEWGYRDPVEGGFIEDQTPFEAAVHLTAAMQEIERQRASARSARAEALEEVATWHEQRAKELVALAKTAGDDQGLFREAMHHRFSATAIRSLKTAPKGDGEGT